MFGTFDRLSNQTRQNQAFQGSAIAPFDAAKLLNEPASAGPSNPCHGNLKILNNKVQNTKTNLIHNFLNFA